MAPRLTHSPPAPSPGSLLKTAGEAGVGAANVPQERALTGRRSAPGRLIHARPESVPGPSEAAVLRTRLRGADCRSG